jgi:hypothetical protein
MKWKCDEGEAQMKKHQLELNYQSRMRYQIVLAESEMKQIFCIFYDNS